MGEPEKVISSPTSTGEPVGSPVPDATSQELEQLRAFKAAYDTNIAPFVEKVTPYWDNVAKYVDDENYRQVADNAWKGFDAIRADQKPEIPEYVKSQDEKIDRLVKFTDTIAQQQKIENYGKQVVALATEYPVLSENNFEKVGELIKRAEKIGVSTPEQFIDYVRDVAPSLQTAKPKEPEPKKTPKPSLRGDASAPGLADTPMKVPKTAKEMRSFIRSRVGATGGQ
jgi:hypothetical protein